jgi:hypothetical protein
MHKLDLIIIMVIVIIIKYDFKRGVWGKSVRGKGEKRG